MINTVSSILPSIKSIPSVPGSNSDVQESGKADFGQVLNQALDNVNQIQKNADDTTNQFMAGKLDNMHTMMIEGQKADLALQFTLQVRNKVLDAYNEIMRMAI